MRRFVTFAVASAVAVAASTAPTLVAQTPAPPFVRGLYVNRYAAESDRKMHHLIALADTTEILRH